MFPTISFLLFLPNVGGEAYSNLVTINDTIYSIGENGYLNQVYDPSTNTWDLKASMPTSRDVFGTVACGGKIYVIGGSTQAFVDVSINEAYDPSTNSWSTATPMPTPRLGLGLVALGDKIYAIGGVQEQGSNTSIYLTKNEVFTIPEFPLFLVLQIFMTAALLVVITYRRKELKIIKKS